MTTAANVVAKFGGQAALAKLLGTAQSTVQYWVQSGTIPAKRHPALLALARERGIELYPGDFIAPPEGDQSGTVDEDTLPVAKWPGTLVLGDLELPVYVLDDGRRVLSKTGATELLSDFKKGGSLKSYIGAEALAEYLPADISEHFIEFVIPGSGRNGVGMTAELFID